MATIELKFRPGVTTHIEIADRNLLFYAAPLRTGRVPDQEAVIENALQHPIESPLLEGILEQQAPRGLPGTVAVLVDDITRPTPTARILPSILARVAASGIPDKSVRICIATGTHRPMTQAELRVKLGADVLAHYDVLNRDYREGDYVSLGSTQAGTPVEVERQVAEASVKIAIGNVVPHVSAGWGGGSKIILPGVCSQKTTDRMHLMACTVQPVLEVVGTRDNKPRAEMDAIARKLGLDFILNTVLDEEQNILGAFAGHFVAAHRQAVALAEQALVAPVPRQADIVIVSAIPCHVDYWQGAKPYIFSHLAVREKGIIIFLLDGEEGLCGDAPSHEETVRRYLAASFEEQVAAVEQGLVRDIAGLNVPMYHAMVRHRVTKTICVTRHLSTGDIAALGFDQAPDVQAALCEAYRVMGPEASVGVIPFGGETLVRVAPQRAAGPALPSR
jgi:nickel-dependent lactate racemase